MNSINFILFQLFVLVSCKDDENEYYYLLKLVEKVSNRKSVRYNYLIHIMIEFEIM
jgi:hypothetical protein